MDNIIITGLLSILFLSVGLIIGFIASEKYTAYMNHTRHDFEELFEKNPHPELFDENGKLDRGEYMNISFEPGYNPDEFDPEDIHEL